ncbi:hypothetical protein FMEXI_9699 [Fusarium mexicanum]|uniref:HAUS augmin-like complex subunit 6 N-terminal domain-containing protein n=1 Tax=Fusarium mexicanum TaxID=751941 RepID=A0A8H5MRA3_9HYPO|nr:hypothetical protein FMEXI_9699 [Fusarium mexicanum]
MSPSGTGNERLMPLAKRQRVGEDDERERKDAVAIRFLTTSKNILTHENEALNQRLKEAQNATSLETKEKDALKTQNIELKASCDSATQDVKSLRLQWGEAKTAEEKCRDALSKVLSAEHSPMIHLAKTHNCQITIPIKDHSQVMWDIVPLVGLGKQEHINRLLDFVFFGWDGEWFCFKAGSVAVEPLQPPPPPTLPSSDLFTLPSARPYLIYTPPFQVVPAYLPEKLHKRHFHSRNTFFQHVTMAAAQPRTRSARLVAGFTNKSTQHAPATAPSPHVHHGPPALSIFLTNLNLLDLDQHEDWPGIKAQTFASGGSSAQGLKKRVHCVEWALFQLFALWDPDETKKKLKPFFPPLDQTQSVNLRAALLRALEQAKKNGVLGRDAIVRKTMLDECRGERLEEVLAAFSSAVLKHVIAQEVATSGEHTALALGLALEDRGYKSDNTDLNTMVLAHKVAISRILNSKVAASSRFRDFADLLNVKEKGIARRKEALDALEGGKTISEDARRELWRTLRNNWSGNERWMETLLYGDASTKKDGLLGMPFDRVWRRVQQGRLGELEEHSTGLLEQLDTRVRVQRERLQKWQTFRNRLSADQPKPSPSKAKQKEKENGIDFGFGAHEALHLGSGSPKKATFGKPKLLNEYEDLVSNLSQELQSTKPQKSSALDFLQRPSSQNTPAINAPAPEPQEEEEEAISELEDEDGFAETPIQSFKSKLDKSRRLPVRPKLAHTDDSFASISSRARNLRKPSEDEARILRASSVERTSSPEPEDEPVTASPRPEYDVSPELSPQISPQPSPPPSPLPLQESPELMPARPSPTQEMADQILESMDMASPSPVKRRPKPRHTLSLAERTRLTMARGAFDPDNEDIDISPPTSSEPVSVEDPSQTPVDDEFDLIARTRKSMAGFDKARQKAQLDRRRSMRKTKAPPKKEGSYFPKVEEEDMTIITDELMAQEDMEAVFRSRPKIKASPLPSPTRDWDDDEYM